MTRLKRWLLVVAALGAVAVGTAYAASAGSNDPPATPSPKTVAASAAGMPPTAQVWYAVVNADATLARGFPQNGTGTWLVSSKIATGAYQVQFKQDLTGCSYVATLGNPGAGDPAHGTIVVAARSGNAKAVFVETTDVAGNLADRPFHLQVAC